MTTPGRVLRSTLAAGIVGAALLLAAPAWPAGPASAAERATLERQLADAKARLETAAHEVAELSRRLWGEDGPGAVKMLQVSARGAMIGVNIATDKPRPDGVEVVGVSPGGPAEAAGIRTGDVIVAVDGQPLVAREDRTAAAQLTGYLRGLEPGRTVRLDCLRDGRRRSVEVRTVAAEPPIARLLRERGWMPPGGVPPAPFDEFLGPGGALRELELVAMTPELGRYFGTEQGLLVVRKPADAAFRLEDGDVLLSIDGRIPETPGHAFRILRSYEPGERFTLQILRLRKRVELPVTLPAGAVRGQRPPIPPPEPPPLPQPRPSDAGPA